MIAGALGASRCMRRGCRSSTGSRGLVVGGGGRRFGIPRAAFPDRAEAAGHRSRPRGQGGTSTAVGEGGVVSEEAARSRTRAAPRPGRCRCSWPRVTSGAPPSRATVAEPGSKTTRSTIPQRCFEGTLDCDHSENAGRGIAYGDGWFVVTWGWGPRHVATQQRWRGLGNGR